MARGTAHSDEVRAAVMSALLAGQSVGKIAEEYRIHHSVVSRWRNRLPSNQLHEVAHKKGADFAALLADYLSTLLVALTAQAVTLADPAYIRGQSAAEMAILHGVIADKAIRILEAVARDNSSSDGNDWTHPEGSGGFPLTAIQDFHS